MRSPNAPKARSSRSISGVAQTKIDWNTTTISSDEDQRAPDLVRQDRSRRSLTVTRPPAGCVTTPSSTAATQS